MPTERRLGRLGTVACESGSEDGLFFSGGSLSGLTCKPKLSSPRQALGAAWNDWWRAFKDSSVPNSLPSEPPVDAVVSEVLRREGKGGRTGVSSFIALPGGSSSSSSRRPSPVLDGVATS